MGDFAKFHNTKNQEIMQSFTLAKLSGQLTQEMIKSLEDGIIAIEQGGLIQDNEDREALENFKDWVYGITHLDMNIENMDNNNFTLKSNTESKPNVHVMFQDDGTRSSTSWGKNFIMPFYQLAQNDPPAFCELMEKEIVAKIDYWQNAYKPGTEAWEIFLENMGAVISLAQITNHDPKIRTRLIKICDDIGLPDIPNE